METLYFKCTLLTDVIINSKAASEGDQKTLDFIPGNNFLGIAASSLYEKDVDSLSVFHSGKVRFGDAHPGLNETRSLRMPASFYFPKGAELTDGVYIHHFYDKNSDKLGINNGPQQLKQCRTGFYMFNEDIATKIETPMSFSIKSKYNPETRASEKGKMFGYQSLNAGGVYYFSIESDMDSETNKKIAESLKGNRRLGRSRSAQYGLVEIKTSTFTEVQSQNKPLVIGKKNHIAVYADGRLIFLDKDSGMPTFQPTSEQLGLPAGKKIIWELSQIRTFQYAPWNFKRQAFDTDRCGIEKGSVFIVECETSPNSSKYVGSYNNEGFGKVIYNPYFLCDFTGNGIANVKFPKAEEFPKPEDADSNPGKENNKEETLAPLSPKDNVLLTYLSRHKAEENSDARIQEKVNKFVSDNVNLFKGQFASQWGTIRSIALSHSDNAAIKLSVEEYISKGVKSDAWFGVRSKVLETFMTENKDRLKLALINLSSEMAKRIQND